MHLTSNLIETINIIDLCLEWNVVKSKIYSMFTNNCNTLASNISTISMFYNNIHVIILNAVIFLFCVVGKIAKHNISVG